MAMDIGKNVKQYRQRLKLTQLELAKKIEVSESYICQIENGKMVSLRKLEELAEALGCSPKDLL